MKFNCVSECLVLSGTFLLSLGTFPILGIMLIVIGILGGILDFLYYVHEKQNIETRKSQIYSDIKSIFSGVQKSFTELDKNETAQRKTTNTLH